MSSNDLSGSYKQKFTRTKTGCLRCRKGKHKCDEERPQCRRCRHAKGECVYPPPLVRKTRELHRKRARTEDCRDTSRFEELDDNGRTGSGSRRGSNHREGSDTPSLIATPSDLLTLAFPDSQERELMNHLLSYGTIVMYAIAKPNQPVHFLDVSQCLQYRRGSSFETDAVLLSLVSIAAIHQASIFMQLEKKYLTTLPGGRWGTSSVSTISPTVGNQTRMRTIGKHCSKAAFELCKATVALKMTDIQSPTKELSNILLSSIVSVIISECLAGGTQWQGAFDLAISLIETRGGPDEVLSDAQAESPSTLTRVRTLIENLVVVDVCRCLATGVTPRIMVEPFAPWWFDYVPESSQSDTHDTVQHAYGVDRGVVELVNRVNILYGESLVVSSLLDKSYLERHQQKIQDLQLELDIWENSTSIQKGTLTRLQVGNAVMTHTMRVVMLVDLLGTPHADAKVQAHATLTLHYLEYAFSSDIVVGLLLPKIIVGSMMFDAAGRDRARKLITGLRSTVAFSYDVENAADMLEQLFRMRDDGTEDPSWRDVVKEDTLLI